VRLHTDLSKGWGCASRKGNKLTRPLVAIILSSEETLLFYVPLVWKVTFEVLEPADLNDRICAVRVVRFAGQKPVLDTL
jgi:hypothetical protein